MVGTKTRVPYIVQEKLVQDDIKLVVPADHEWADRASVICRALLSQPFIAREQGAGTWKTVIADMEKAGVTYLGLRACLVIRGSKRNLVKMRRSFYKFAADSRTIHTIWGNWGHFYGISADSSIIKQALKRTDPALHVP